MKFDYDYKKGKKRVEQILDNKLEIVENDKLPNDENFTYENAYKSFVTSIFVDIRDSTNLFSKHDSVEVSKIIRSFTSEIIEILREDDNLRAIGIRGDCVYAVYTTPYKTDVYNVYKKTVYINTYIKMLNKMLKKRGFETIHAGIGMSTAKELIIKAGRKDTGINDKVWIGDAVTRACNLASLGENLVSSGSDDRYKRLIYSEFSYDNFIKEECKKIGSKEPINWFDDHRDEYGVFYDASIVIGDFNRWVESDEF